MPLIITRGLGQSSGSTPTPSGATGSQVPISTQSGPSTVDFGTDFDFLSGLNPAFALVTGYYNLGQALAHRLQTPRGGLFYDLDYGTDIRGYVNMAITGQVASQLVGDIQSECLKDERVQTVTAAQSMNAATSTLTITITGTTSDGPFTFILSVTSATVALLSPQQNS
jgi:hypothetical protein